MSANTRHLVVVGQGAAGLAAALSAAEEARRGGSPVRITLIDKASEEEAGGNTRWSPSYMRMAAPDRVEPNFVQTCSRPRDSRATKPISRALPRTHRRRLRGLHRKASNSSSRRYYLAKGPPRIQPLGGGPAIVTALTRAAKQAGVMFRYGCAAREIATQDGRIAGVVVAQGNATETIPADAIVLACGGFQGDGDMMREHFGAHAPKRCG